MTNPRKDADPSDNFSLQDFKKWMHEHATNEFVLAPQKKGVGVEVEPRVNLKRLVARMEPEEGETLELAREFKKNGGRIAELDGSLCMVEVENGSFIIPRVCIRKRD